MADTRAEDMAISERWDQDELSEMMSLLQRAAQRMRNLDPDSKHTMRNSDSEKYYGGSTSHDESNLQTRLHKLNPGPIAQPYIISAHGIARADQIRLVDEKDRHSTAHRLEDPVVMKKRAKKVREFVCLPFSAYDEK